MRPRIPFAAIGLVVVLSLALPILTSCKVTQNSAAQEESGSDIQDASPELTTPQVDADHPVTATTEPVAGQAVAEQDGLALLKQHCARCHVAIIDDQVEKSRSEWLVVLERMEEMGVKLDETEREALLDYLAAADEQ